MKKYMYTDAHTDTCISIAEKWQEAESSTFFAQHCVLCFPLISAPPPVPHPPYRLLLRPASPHRALSVAHSRALAHALHL